MLKTVVSENTEKTGNSQLYEIYMIIKIIFMNNHAIKMCRVSVSTLIANMLYGKVHSHEKVKIKLFFSKKRRFKISCF